MSCVALVIIDVSFGSLSGRVLSFVKGSSCTCRDDNVIFIVGHCILVKETAHREDVIIVNIRAVNAGSQVHTVNIAQHQGTERPQYKYSE